MSVSTIPRILRVVYPAAVFTAVFFSWSATGQGVQSLSLLPRPKKPEFSYRRTLASPDTASCKLQDRLWPLSLRDQCADSEPPWK